MILLAAAEIFAETLVWPSRLAVYPTILLMNADSFKGKKNVERLNFPVGLDFSECANDCRQNMFNVLLLP
jgi:hypothetical protein